MAGLRAPITGQRLVGYRLTSGAPQPCRETRTTKAGPHIIPTLAAALGVTAECHARALTGGLAQPLTRIPVARITGSSSRGEDNVCLRWFSQSDKFRCEIARGASAARLGRAFCGVDVAINQLKVRQAPIIKQFRPGSIPILVPHPKQWDAVVNLGALPEASAGFAAASRLQAAQKPGLTTWCIPKLPCDHTGAVPYRILIGPSVPQIDMPAEPINRLPTHAAESWTQRVVAFAIGRRWRPECGWQPDLGVIAEPPAPAARRPAPGSKRARQPIGAKRMGAPIGINREPRRRRHERTAERPR